MTSVALCMTTFLPLMKETSSDPRIINCSSSRGSFGLVHTVQPSPVPYIAYSMSKTSANVVTLSYAAAPDNKAVWFQNASPGLCRTDLNPVAKTAPYARDPVAGAEVFVRLALADRSKYKNAGFWQMEAGDEEPMSIPW